MPFRVQNVGTCCGTTTRLFPALPPAGSGREAEIDLPGSFSQHGLQQPLRSEALVSL